MVQRWFPDWRTPHHSLELGYHFGRAGVEWFPWERTGFTLDYTYTRIEADADKDSFSGNVDFKDAGLRLGFVYRF